MRPYKQLDLEERRKIETWRAAKVSVDVIAERLGRNRSTIFRELRRNHFTDAEMPKVVGYFGVVASMKALSRRQKDRKLMRHAELRELIIERIKDGWTPEQIAGRLIYEKAPVRVCQETIYRFVYSPEGMKEDLWWYLPEHRRKRRPRKGRVPKKPKIHPDLGIANRPEIIGDRIQFGHWESDLMLFRQKFGKANVTSLVERVSRFTVLLMNANKTTARVMGRLANVMRTLPHNARKSVTFDRGSEFMDWPHLQAEVGTQTWFCDPSAPWQKGTVENTNRRARRWLPRELDVAKLTPHDLEVICARLNATPRKCLGWKTPAEVFKEKVLDQAA
jgi:IS30 family transposase